MGSLFGYGFSPWGYGGFGGDYGGYRGFSPFQAYGGMGNGGMDFWQAILSQMMQQPQAQQGMLSNQAGSMMPTPQSAMPDTQPQGLPPDVYGISPTEMPQFAPPSPDVYGISPIEQPAQPPPAPMVTSQAGPQSGLAMMPGDTMRGRGGYGGGKGMNRGGRSPYRRY